MNGVFVGLEAEDVDAPEGQKLPFTIQGEISIAIKP
jgi:hypothetical protein